MRHRDLISFLVRLWVYVLNMVSRASYYIVYLWPENNDVSYDRPTRIARVSNDERGNVESHATSPSCTMPNLHATWLHTEKNLYYTAAAAATVVIRSDFQHPLL